MAYEAGGVNTDMENQINFHYTRIYDNYAIRVGGINILTKCQMWIYDSIIENNIAENEISAVNLFGTALVGFI